MAERERNGRGRENKGNRELKVRQQEEEVVADARWAAGREHQHVCRCYAEKEKKGKSGNNWCVHHLPWRSRMESTAGPGCRMYAVEMLNPKKIECDAHCRLGMSFVLS